MPDLIVYGLPGSPFVRKVLTAIAEKGVDAELQPTSPFGKPPDWFLEINPAKRIPVLRDRSIGTEGVPGTIPDSSAICAYIEKKHPEPPLYPSDPFEYGRAVWFEEFADSELAGVIGMHIFRPIFFPLLAGGESDVEAARKGFNEILPGKLDYLETMIRGREFFVGEAFGIADIAIGCQLGSLELAGGSIEDARWPELADFWRRTGARPSVEAEMDNARGAMPSHDITL